MTGSPGGRERESVRGRQAGGGSEGLRTHLIHVLMYSTSMMDGIIIHPCDSQESVSKSLLWTSFSESDLLYIG